jgi:purine catabolism regulator
MEMLVADLLKKKVFPDFKLLAGSQGLSSKLRGVSVIDCPDMYYWARGGEFLLGSGFIFKNNPESLTSFIRHAWSKNVAAIGFKLGRYLSEYPPEAIEAANELGLPLIDIPMKYKWIDIIEFTHDLLYLERKPPQGNIQDGFLTMWDDIWDIRRSLLGLAKTLGREIIVIAPQIQLNNVFSPHGESLDFENADTFLQSPVIKEISLPREGNIQVSIEHKEIDNNVIIYSVYRLKTDSVIEVYLRLNESEEYIPLQHQRMVLRAISLLRTSIMEERLISSKLQAHKERFLENLCLGMYNDAKIVQQKAQSLDISFPDDPAVLIVASRDQERSHLPTPIYSSLQVHAYRIGFNWVCIDSASNIEKNKQHIDELARENDLWISMGSPAKDVLGLARSYSEAKKSYFWLREFKPVAGFYSFNNLLVQTLFSQVVKLPEAKDLWDRYWLPLKTDKNTRRIFPLTEVAKTLIKQDFNARKAAEILHLHYNTIRNYIEELERVLGISLDDQLNRQALILAYYVDISREN